MICYHMEKIMITFNVDKPFSQDEINNLIHLEEERVQDSFKKGRFKGLVIIILGIVLYYILNINFNVVGHGAEKEMLKFALLVFWVVIGFSFLVIPYMLGSSSIYSMYFLPYTTANNKKIHDCEAFVNMPSMEEYKNYVQMVQLQGRPLINFECDTIINHWDSLAEKEKETAVQMNIIKD